MISRARGANCELRGMPLEIGRPHEVLEHSVRKTDEPEKALAHFRAAESVMPSLMWSRIGPWEVRREPR